MIVSHELLIPFISREKEKMFYSSIRDIFKNIYLCLQREIYRFLRINLFPPVWEYMAQTILGIQYSLRHRILAYLSSELLGNSTSLITDKLLEA